MNTSKLFVAIVLIQLCLMVSSTAATCSISCGALESPGIWCTNPPAGHKCQYKGDGFVCQCELSGTKLAGLIIGITAAFTACVFLLVACTIRRKKKNGGIQMETTTRYRGFDGSETTTTSYSGGNNNSGSPYKEMSRPQGATQYANTAQESWPPAHMAATTGATPQPPAEGVPYMAGGPPPPQQYQQQPQQYATGGGGQAPPPPAPGPQQQFTAYVPPPPPPQMQVSYGNNAAPMHAPAPPPQQEKNLY